MRELTRREAILAAGMAGAGTLLGPGVTSGAGRARAVEKGRLKQAVSRWCYGRIPLPDFCRVVAEMGLGGIDLLGEDDWPVLSDHGLVCTMGSGGGGTIAEGLNDPANHEGIVKGLTEMIPRAAKAGVPNVITMIGNRKPGLDDPTARDNCVTALKRVQPVAEAEGVTVCVELLNSKVDHEGYQGDHTEFVVDVVKAVDSPRVKALYDIYHMQIMEGDIIRTIRDNAPWIGHYHTGGVPGRHELDDTQELNYPAICRAIVETGFSGYLAHEFVPTGDDILASLRDAVQRCDV
ncbi:MAG: TIM barrel protein [Acidobacteria bacterium]|jgi:hydroxypyruvate isomerase|nr:TIM barrel protein [Acidobacteriota bacterium]